MKVRLDQAVVARGSNPVAESGRELYSSGQCDGEYQNCYKSWYARI